MKTIILYVLLIYCIFKFFESLRNEKEERRNRDHMAVRKYLSEGKGIEIYNLFVDGLLRDTKIEKSVDHPELFKKLSSLQEFDTLGTEEKEIAEYIVKKLINGGEELEEMLRSEGMD